jgi:hypothetical protein
VNDIRPLKDWTISAPASAGSIRPASARAAAKSASVNGMRDGWPVPSVDVPMSSGSTSSGSCA